MDNSSQDVTGMDVLNHEARTWVDAKGILVLHEHPSLKHVTFTLTPVPYPRNIFSHAVALAPDFNLLIHRISQDPQFIIDILQNLREQDSFVDNLLRIYQIILGEGIKQKARLGLFRHDYMLHEATDNKILQLVELNTISCSLSVLSPTVARLHRFLAFKYPSKYPYSYEQVLDTESDRETPRTMYEAWKLYNRPNSVILFIVLANERNISEHKDIEYALAERKVRVIRKTFTQVHEEGKLASDGALLIGDHEIAVVYFRTGYMPDQYASQKEWDARLMIERSLAIKTPSVDYQLIGLKKIQQVLSLPGTLERFLPDEPEKVQRLRSSFTGNYELGQEDSDILKEIRKRPQDFVMKPQREGGGNNFYGEEIIKQLDKIKPEERKIYVVMDKIVPKPRSTYFHHNDEISIQEETISEVGTFANFLSDGEKILINQYGGYAVKTKSIKNSEGGVLAGFAAVDSLCLVDE